MPKQEAIGTVFKDEISCKWSLKVLIDNEVQIKRDFFVLNITEPETFCWMKPGMNRFYSFIIFYLTFL